MTEETQLERPHATQEVHSTRTALLRLAEDPGKWAIFLDIDGTLLDMALTPDGISVPPTLPMDLHWLAAKLGGAMALVTGRALLYADELFSPFHFPVAGLHGAEIRGADGSVSLAKITPEFEELKHALAREAEAMPGVLIEDKGGAVAAHYRLAPDYEDLLGERMRHYAQEAGAGWALQLGKMVFEIRPARASKGDAVEFFMQQHPFSDRLPLAIGDDLTDESMFAVANARGGHSIRVGQPASSSCAVSTAPDPTYIRQQIAALVSGGVVK